MIKGDLIVMQKHNTYCGLSERTLCLFLQCRNLCQEVRIDANQHCDQLNQQMKLSTTTPI